MANTFQRRLLAWLACGLAGSALAEGSGPWRIYRTTDGLAATSTTAVTLSPRGIVWARHGSGGSISWLDGFQIHTLQSTNDDSFPIYESRSGQIWSPYADGVREFRRDQWLQYPLAEVRTENQSSSLRLVRPIPILPAERDRVLVLLPEQLLKFDVAQQATTPLRLAKASSIGRFNEMVEARDGGAWVTGSNGLARIPTPLRRFTADASWEESLPNPAWRIQNLERPFEDDEGGVTVVADSLVLSNRVVLYFNGREWEAPIPAPNRIRLAWRSTDQAFWALTGSSLLKRESNRWEPVEIPGTHGAQLHFFDAAVQANGIFWLATSGGLVRYSPPTWRTPSELAEVKSSVSSIAEDRQGGVWFATADGLRGVQGGKSESISWPSTLSHDLSTRVSLYMLAGSKIAFLQSDGIAVYDPSTREYMAVKPPPARRVKAILGQFRNGDLCVQTTGPETGGPFLLESFDGREFKTVLAPGSEWSLGNTLFVFHETEDKSVWIGGNEGLGFIDARSETHSVTRQLSAGQVFCLLEFERGKVWCGGENGVFEFDGKNWSRHAGNLGLVRSLRKAPDGSVWTTTSTGILRFVDGSWVSNSTAEGLPVPQIHDVWPDRRGNIWAGTAKGISLYHPTADIDPPVAIPDPVNNLREVSSADRVVLFFTGRDKWDQTPVNRLLYSHRLDERPWTSYTGDLSVTYTNLLAGEHRFELRAMDRNWNEQPQPQSFQFTAVIPWFREPRLLVMALAALAATASLAALAVNRHLRLVRSYAEVGRIVEQRTRELERANQELLHSQKMRALGTLAAGIAHDFNNILSIIKGSAQIIEANTHDPEKIKTRLDRIKTVVDQGTSIVKAMLGFSRVSSRKESECDLNQLVSETTRLLGDQFLKDITLRLDVASALPKVESPAELIQQMLLNLIINAADAMDGHGEIILRTRLRERLPSDLVLTPTSAPRFVSIEVQDTGSGIAPEVLPRIFEPFFTTKALSTRRGTGLGLSMVYEIAKELGYGIQVESVAGRGSSFTLITPVTLKSQT